MKRVTSTEVRGLLCVGGAVVIVGMGSGVGVAWAEEVVVAGMVRVVVRS